MDFSIRCDFSPPSVWLFSCLRACHSQCTYSKVAYGEKSGAILVAVSFLIPYHPVLVQVLWNLLNSSFWILPPFYLYLGSHQHYFSAISQNSLLYGLPTSGPFALLASQHVPTILYFSRFYVLHQFSPLVGTDSFVKNT